ENYLFHYVYMSKPYYETIFASDVVFENMLTIMADKNIELEGVVTKDLIDVEGISGLNWNSTLRSSFDDTVESLNYVVLLMIVSAGALAFVVLYNLTNVNISERMREIATIKVLGFYDKEVSAYIYRENMILTVIGTGVGLGLGILLHRFIMLTVEMDMMMFGRNLDPLSFVYSGVLTIFFSVLVNVAMYYKLKNIEMVESLKSVD
ncbi:MAG: FtsX-like permease family protein, partial [Turicibacter sp.]